MASTKDNQVKYRRNTEGATKGLLLNFGTHAFRGLYKQISAANFVSNPTPMQLMMYIGNDLIEAVPLDKDKVPVPGYLGKIKRHLKDKYREAIEQSEDIPDFLVINSFSKNEQVPH